MALWQARCKALHLYHSQGGLHEREIMCHGCTYCSTVACFAFSFLSRFKFAIWWLWSKKKSLKPRWAASVEGRLLWSSKLKPAKGAPCICALWECKRISQFAEFLVKRAGSISWQPSWTTACCSSCHFKHQPSAKCWPSAVKLKMTNWSETVWSSKKKEPKKVPLSWSCFFVAVQRVKVTRPRATTAGWAFLHQTERGEFVGLFLWHVLWFFCSLFTCDQ